MTHKLKTSEWPSRFNGTAALGELIGEINHSLGLQVTADNAPFMLNEWLIVPAEGTALWGVRRDV